jgi:hypothetical protein
MTNEIIQKEIETRKLTTYARKIAKHLYNKNFNDLSFDELKEVLSILDRYGSKYLQFYKFNNEEDKKTFISNLSNYGYQPIFHFEEQEKLEKVFVHKTSNNENFEIMFNFEVIEEKWESNEDNTIKKIKYIPRRRVLYIHNIRNYIILAIDPIGIGIGVAGSEHLEKYKKQIENILNNSLFDRINKINIENAIRKLIEEQILTGKGIKYEDMRTQRETETICKSSHDNLKDIIVRLPSDKNIQDLKLKYDKISLELFGKDLLKIKSQAKATEEIHNEIKTSIISILQKQ